jgi:hypothetical protein
MSDTRLTTIERDLMVIEWMLGTNIGLMLLVLWKVW